MLRHILSLNQTLYSLVSGASLSQNLTSQGLYFIFLQALFCNVLTTRDGFLSFINLNFSWVPFYVHPNISYILLCISHHLFILRKYFREIDSLFQQTSSLFYASEYATNDGRNKQECLHFSRFSSRTLKFTYALLILCTRNTSICKPSNVKHSHRT